MIIRKPYAFLIKNFRLINLLILVFSLLVVYRSSIALDFFNDYVDTRQFIENDNLINDTIPLFMIIISGMLVFLSMAIAILFKKKDKPTLFYFSAVIYYIIFIIVCFVSRGIIKTIIYDGLDPRISRIVRDIWFIGTILQFAVVAFSLVRTLGFDVRKFNFGEDLHELEISDEDNEEIEVVTRFDSDKAKMRAAMQREELKAFFLENKVMIILILFILIVVIPGAFIAKNIVDNKRYQIGEVIDLNKFDLKITGAYLSKKDYTGKTLFKGNNSYLVVSFNIKNFTDKERGITLNNLRLEVNGKIYMPKTSYYEYFTDIGVGYDNNKIGNESKNFIAVYVISDDDINHEMIIRYADKLTVKDSKVNAVYYRTIIKPENIDRNINVVNYKLGNSLLFDYNKKDNINFSVSHYNLKDKFTYDVNGKTKYIINNVGLVLSLNYSYASNVSFSDFINDFVSIKYRYNGNMFVQNIKNITPKGYKSNEVYFAVSEILKDATEIYLVVNTRNTEYMYKIK